MKNLFAQQREACSAISLPFDEFQFGDVALYHAVVDPPGEAIFHGLFVFFDSSSERLEFGKLAPCYLLQPGIKACSCAIAQHLGKLLNQVIGQIDLRVKLTKFGQRFLFLDTDFLWTTKKQEGSLSYSRKSRSLRWGVKSIFAPVWKPTNKDVADALIASLIALCDEFLEKVGDIVAPSFPALDQIGEIAIHLAGLLTWFALRKPPSSQPALHGARADSHLPRNSRLTQAELM